jgi:hypothetical protein
MEGCEIQGIFRVDGKLTNCETGDRLVISKLLSKPIPRMLKIGKYIARVFHPGQPEFQNSVFLLFVVLTFLGESFAGSGLFMLPLVEEASLVEAFVDLFLFVIVSRQ